jgi:hypothetical protein
VRRSEKWKVKVRGGAEGSCLVLGYVDLRSERVDYGSVRWLSTATTANYHTDILGNKLKQQPRSQRRRPLLCY